MGLGRMGGPKAGGPDGYCKCPKCGYRTPHTRGNPCYNRYCPNCRVPLTRE